MRILDRYILKEALGSVLVTLFVFTAILLTLRMLQFASLIINKGVHLSQIATVFLAIVPTFLELAIPMAALLGVMMAFARLSGDSEIVVLRASGVSLLQLVRPILYLALALGALSLYVSIVLRPWSFNVLGNTLFEIARTKSTAGLEAGVFNKLGQLTLYTEAIDDRSGKLGKVMVDDRREKAGRKIVFASSGRIVSDEVNRKIIVHLFEGDIHELADQNYLLTHFTTNSLVMNPDELYVSDEPRERKSRELYLSELREQIAAYRHELGNAQAQLSERELNRQIGRLEGERGRRFSMPYASFILAVLGMFLGIQPPRTQRTWGAGLSVVIGLAVFVLYYGLLSIGMTLGESGVVKPTLGLWLPNVVATAITIFILQRMMTERWGSILHAVELLLLRFTARAQKLTARWAS